jgi:hypothetical protein
VTKINLITPPDRLYNDGASILLVFPTKENLHYIQQEILPSIEEGLNIYIYEKPNYTKDDVDWLLSTVYQSNIVIVDIDNCPSYVKDLLSHIIAKPQTYWLTNAVNSVYNHISSNRIYNLSILEKLGGSIEKTESTE